MPLKSKKLKAAAAALFLMAMLALTVFAAGWVVSLRDPEKLEAFRGWISSLGIGGWFVLFFIQYVQIVIAFIPGGPIQIVAGALFGTPGGLAVCLGGTLLATASVFFLVSRFGHKVISLFVEERDIMKYKFLSDESRLEKLVMILFFIPGTPKDALTYLFALTKLKMSRFMLLSTVARLPGIITSLVAGDSIAEGNWGRALTMFITMTALAGLGFLLRNWLSKRLGKMRDSGDLRQS